MRFVLAYHFPLLPPPPDFSGQRSRMCPGLPHPKQRSSPKKKFNRVKAVAKTQALANSRVLAKYAEKMSEKVLNRPFMCHDYKNARAHMTGH